MNNTKYKLVCFDLDGTVIDETVFIWQTIHDHLGTDKEERKKCMDDYFSNKITYAQWAESDVEMWQKINAKKADILESIKPLRLMEGALETIKELKSKGIKLAIISGSLSIALEYVFPEYKDYFDDIYINRLVFDEDGKINKIIPTEHDFHNKAVALKEIAEKENIDLRECVFVGDHENDVHVAEEAGLSIAFNCKSDRLAQISDILIEKKDLREILKHILD